MENRVINKIEQERGSIILYVLISMLFFLIVILGIYINSNNERQSQEKEIETIQKEYEEDINDIYEEIVETIENTSKE